MRLSSIVLITVLSAKSALPQQLNYREVFGSDWVKASLFVEENRSWLKQELDEHRISFPVAIAVVFPELVRYSALRDKIEITLLKSLYINLGAEYANFSIGPMQMKPSFAEKIHEYSIVGVGAEAHKLFRVKTDFDDIKDYRARVVSDLENPDKQIAYLIAFLRICEKEFDLTSKDEIERIRFLSTAYNFGFWKTADQIEKMGEGKFFSTTILKTKTYSYADISVFWFRQFTGK